MLTMTNPAGTRLTEVLDRSSRGTIVRVVKKDRRLKLQMGTPLPDDILMSYDGRTVLAYTPNMAKTLKTRTLDVRETDAGPRLKFRRN